MGAAAIVPGDVAADATTVTISAALAADRRLAVSIALETPGSSTGREHGGEETKGPIL